MPALLWAILLQISPCPGHSLRYLCLGSLEALRLPPEALRCAAAWMDSAYLQGTSDAIVSRAHLARFQPYYLVQSRPYVCTRRSLSEFSYHVRCQVPVLAEVADTI